MAPHMNWPTASARLMVVMPRPVDVLSGDTNRPRDWRAPIVTIRIAAAASVTIHALWRSCNFASGLSISMQLKRAELPEDPASRAGHANLRASENPVWHAASPLRPVVQRSAKLACNDSAQLIAQNRCALAAKCSLETSLRLRP